MTSLCKTYSLASQLKARNIYLKRERERDLRLVDPFILQVMGEAGANLS